MSKGKYTEREVRKIYESAEYAVETPNRTGYKGGRTDWYNLFDGMAVHPDRQPRFYQCKTNAASGINQWIDSVRGLLPLDHVTAEFVVRHEGEGFRVLQPASNGYTTVYDGRDDGERMGDRLRRQLRDGGLE